jgi:hypothetical protein
VRAQPPPRLRPDWPILFFRPCRILSLFFVNCLAAAPVLAVARAASLESLDVVYCLLYIGCCLAAAPVLAVARAAIGYCLLSVVCCMLAVVYWLLHSLHRYLRRRCLQ